MSARSTTWPSAWHTYCCLRRDLSVRCSMLKEIPLLRAPEKRRTGMEMSPKVKCPDQTDDGIASPAGNSRNGLHVCRFQDRVAKLQWLREFSPEPTLDAPIEWHVGGAGNRNSKLDRMGV